MWTFYLWHAWRASVHKSLARRFYAAAGRHWREYRRHSYWLGVSNVQRDSRRRPYRQSYASKRKRSEDAVMNGHHPHSPE